jgi:trigger factor
MDVMKVNHDDVHGLEVDVNFTIKQLISWIEPKLFDKLFGANYCYTRRIESKN